MFDQLRGRPARVDPEPVRRRAAPRPGPAPHVRADDRARRARRRARRAAPGTCARAGPTTPRSQGARRGVRQRGVLGRDRRDHRRPALPRDHRLPAVRRPPRAHRADLEGRARDLGRGDRRRGRGVDRRPPPQHGVRRHRRLDRPRARVRAGDRPVGQLVQPGAVRRTVDAAVGGRDRPCAPSGRIRAVRDVPTDLPLRVAVVPRARVRAALRSTSAFKLVRGQLFALYAAGYTAFRLADGGDAHRPRAHDRTAARQRLGEHRRVRDLGRSCSSTSVVARAPCAVDDGDDGPSTVVGERAAP